MAHLHFALALACCSSVVAACGGGNADHAAATGAGGASATGTGGTGTSGTAGTSSGAGASPVGSGGDTGAAGAAGGDPGPAFIAFTDSFKDFMTWPSFYLGEVPPTVNEMPGPRTIYINKLPPKGSTTFPVGTVIVKAIQIGDPKTWQIFAMAKRGADFNALGAVGWEWFELSLKFDALNILWRGNAPPSGMGYGGGVSGGVCNTCHGGAKANDFVQNSFLQLSTL